MPALPLSLCAVRLSAGPEAAALSYGPRRRERCGRGEGPGHRLGSVHNDGPESFPLLFLWGERVVAGVASVAARPFWSFPVWGVWAHVPLPPPAHSRNPRQAWLPRLAAQQHQREKAGQAAPRIHVPQSLRLFWFLLGILQKASCYCPCAWRGEASAGSRWAFPRPKWAGNGTQITYANPRSCGPIFLKYANKSHRVRAGFDRQAGRPGRLAGSAG